MSGESNPVNDLFGTREVLGLALKKLASQALVFGFVMVLVLAGVGWLFRENPSAGVAVIFAVLFVFLVALVAYLFFEEKQKVAREDPATMNQLLGDKMKTIEHPTEGWTVQLWTERVGSEPPAGQRDVQVIPKAAGSAYRVGDRIVVRFRVNRDCHLTLLNVGTSGKLTILFPNALHRENAIRAKEEYAIPGPGDGFEYQLLGPPGVEKLKAIATTQPVRLLESNFAPDGSLFRTVAPAAGARDIGIIQKQLESLPPQDWGEASCEFRVT